MHDYSNIPIFIVQDVFIRVMEPITLKIKVIQASNLRGSKGEHLNSFIRVQFADFDFKDVGPFKPDDNLQRLTQPRI
jgi:hypothetical protein